MEMHSYMQMCGKVSPHFVNTDHDNDMIAELPVSQKSQ